MSFWDSCDCCGTRDGSVGRSSKRSAQLCDPCRNAGGKSFRGSCRNHKVKTKRAARGSHPFIVEGKGGR